MIAHFITAEIDLQPAQLHSKLRQNSKTGRTATLGSYNVNIERQLAFVEAVVTLESDVWAAPECEPASLHSGLIVPTGIGAAIGVQRCIASCKAIAFADRLITHPNVLNGAQLYWPCPCFYVEGYGLDQFAAQVGGCAQSIKT